MADSIFSNRHIVDKLADVRERLKELKAEEEMLKDAVLASGDVEGDEHIAQITESERGSLDRAKLEAKFGKATIAACCKTTTVVAVRVLRKARPK